MLVGGVVVLVGMYLVCCSVCYSVVCLVVCFV